MNQIIMENTLSIIKKRILQGLESTRKFARGEAKVVLYRKMMHYRLGHTNEKCIELLHKMVFSSLLILNHLTLVSHAYLILNEPRVWQSSKTINAFTQNRVLSKWLWIEKRVWGCEAYGKGLTSDGYPRETKGYYFYIGKQGKIFVARKVFLEK
ncbi:hypothetical protein ACJX0J_031507 [Zea mays]